MNLTDILLFGNAINGGGGSSDNGLKVAAWTMFTMDSVMESFDVDGMKFIKLSNECPTKEDLQGGLFCNFFEGKTSGTPLVGELLDMTVKENDSGAFVIGDCLVSMSEEAATLEGMPSPSGGIWAMVGDTYGVLGEIATVLVWGHKLDIA